MPGRDAPRKQAPDAPAGQTLTVRLFPNIHGVLIAEFAKVTRRRRAPRAAQLMMIGLLHERAYAHPDAGATQMTPASVAPTPGESGALSIHAEDAAFVSSILNSAES